MLLLRSLAGRFLSTFADKLVDHALTRRNVPANQFLHPLDRRFQAGFVFRSALRRHCHPRALPNRQDRR